MSRRGLVAEHAERVAEDALQRATFASGGGGGGGSTGEVEVRLVNGLNSNVVVNGAKSTIRFFGYTEPVQLGGLVMTPAPAAGQEFTLIFTVPQVQATVLNLSNASVPANQLETGTGSDVDLPLGQAPRARIEWSGDDNRFALLDTGVYNPLFPNAKDWGAEGNGATDDTDDLQLSISTIVGSGTAEGTQGGNRLFLPAGTFVVSPQAGGYALTIPTTGRNAVNLTIEGAGKTATVIMPTAPCNVFSLIYPPNTTSYSGFKIEKLTISPGFEYSTWQPMTAYAPGEYVSSGMGTLLWKCTVGGTSGAYQPFGVMAQNDFLDPQVALNGTPAAQYKQVVVRITTGGTLVSGLVRYEVSLDGGNTATYTGLTASAAPTEIAATGMYVTFSSGLYTAATSLISSGNYFSPTPGFGFSAVHGTTVYEGSLADQGPVWEAVEASGILCVNCDVEIDDVQFYGLPVGLPVGIIFDGVEDSTISNCDFNGENGIWVTGTNQRQNNSVTDTYQDDTTTAGGNRVYNCNFACAQLSWSVCTAQPFSIYGATYEGGALYGWICDSQNVLVESCFSEAGINGMFVGSSAPYSGQYGGGAQTVRFVECMINVTTSPLLAIPIPSEPTLTFTTPYQFCSFKECTLFTGMGDNTFVGTDLGNGLRVTDTIIYATSSSDWFSNGVPAGFVYEDTSDQLGLFAASVGIGCIPETEGVDNMFGYAARAFDLVLANGVNADVDGFGTSYCEISGPTEPFSLAGMSDGADGLERELFNPTGQTFTLNNEDSVDEPVANNRIHTPTGADITNVVTARLRYTSPTAASGANRWLVIAWSTS
jgi:hypothetical protein